MQRARRFLRYTMKPVSAVEVQDIRSYLAQFQEKKPRTYRNQLNAVSVFFRDYLKRPDLVESFRYPEIPFTPPSAPTTEEIRRFYGALKGLKERAFYLLTATSGLRKIEVLGLRREHVDFERRMLMPGHWTGTKNSWISFYNEEAEKVLSEYLASRHDGNPKLFPWNGNYYTEVWTTAQTETAIRITPQKLRNWFSQRMGELGIPDRFVDAFQGRVPKSVLARHYTDYEPGKLKAIYDKAELRVLT